MLSKFVQHIEEYIYNRELIYRSILVVKSSIECEILKGILDKKDYTSHIIEDIDYNIDYNDIDCRIVILCPSKFKEFIYHIYNTSGINTSSYNFIGFNYSIDEDWIDNMISFYQTITHDNNTIILDKHYLKHISIN